MSAVVAVRGNPTITTGPSTGSAASAPCDAYHSSTRSPCDEPLHEHALETRDGVRYVADVDVDRGQ